MAIARDNISAGIAGTGTSLSWTHTVGAGGGLTVECAIGAAGGATATAVNWDTAGVNEALSNTVNAVAASQVGTSGNVTNYIWHKFNVTAGTSKTIKVTASATAEINAGAESVTGWGGSFNAASPQKATGGNTNPTLTLTSATGEWAIDSYGTDNTSQAALTETGTKIYSTSVGLANSNGGAQDKPGAATVTMNWTGVTSTVAWGLVAVSLLPTAASTDTQEWLGSRPPAKRTTWPNLSY